MAKRLVVVSMLVLITIGFAWPQFLNQSPAQDNKTSSAEDDTAERQEFMQKKLGVVYKIVEGIATEDFDMIEEGATGLVTIAESAAFKSTKDPYYRHYSANFEQAAKGLIAAARAESVEKATFAYLHVTVSCTACHQHVRSTVRVAR